MRKALQKLQSVSGVSMILALGLLLICIMVSSSILMAAATGSSRNVNRTKQQQAYLSVASAAELMAEELRNVGLFGAMADRLDYSCACFSDERYESYETVDPASGALAGLMERACLSVAEDPDFDGDCNGINESTRAFQETFTISLPGDQDRIHTVECAFTMYYDFSVTMVLTAEGSDYAITLHMAPKGGDFAYDSQENEEPCLNHTEIIEEPQEDGSVKEDEIIVPHPIVRHIRTLTVEWDLPTLKKGVD